MLRYFLEKSKITKQVLEAANLKETDPEKYIKFCQENDYCDADNVDRLCIVEVRDMDTYEEYVKKIELALNHDVSNVLIFHKELGHE